MPCDVGFFSIIVRPFPRKNAISFFIIIILMQSYVNPLMIAK